jgi:hypothetical protein
LDVTTLSRYLDIMPARHEPTKSGPGTATKSVTRNATKNATKNMVLRLDPELADMLATIADVENRSVSDVAREAIADLVAARRGDRRFRRLLEENLARHQRMLDLLRNDEP